MELRVAHQNLRDLAVIPSVPVAFQGMGIILVQFIVQSAPAEQSPDPALREGFFHLPLKEVPVLGPEAELSPFLQKHGGIVPNPVQHLSCPDIPADHLGHFQVHGFEGGKLQQEQADGQIQGHKNLRLKIPVDLLKSVLHQLRPEGFAGGHEPDGDGHPQGIADGLLQNAGNLASRHRHIVEPEQGLDVLFVKEHFPRGDHTHDSRVLEGHHAPGRRPPGQKHKTAVRGASDILAQCQYIFLRHPLKIIHQEDIPVSFLGDGVLLLPTAPEHRTAGKQDFRHRGFSEAAGGAEEQNPLSLEKFLEFFPNQRPNDNLFSQNPPPAFPYVQIS